MTFNKNFSSNFKFFASQNFVLCKPGTNLTDRKFFCCKDTLSRPLEKFFGKDFQFVAVGVGDEIIFVVSLF